MDTTETPVSLETKRDFLKSHFRYDTANSWNRSTSYARNVKMQRIGAPDNAYDFLDCDEVQDMYNLIIQDFTEEMDGKFTIGFNGRSNGYLVMYRSEYQKDDHKSLCRACGQRSFQDVPEEMKATCGKCGKQERVSYTFPSRLVTFPWRSLDNDVEDMDDSDVEWMYAAVVKFDEACQNCVDSFIQFCKDHVVVEEEIMVQKKIRVVKEKSEVECST